MPSSPSVTKLSSMAFFLLLVAAVAPGHAATGPMFDNLVLVDEVNCGNPADPHEFAESLSGVSQVQTILGQPCRVLPPGLTARYFAYRLGAGKGLQAGKAYILTVDFPEDQPRSMFIVNSGCEQTNGFHTGATLGDALDPPYVPSNAESLRYPLSQQYQTFQTLFHLHDRFFGLKEARDPSPHPHVPADGFWVQVVQFAASQDPLSAGAAAARIALYEAPSYESYSQPINLPPPALPQRHLFWREEMSDSVIGSTDPTMRGVARDADWYEYKARLMKFLGMNTFSKDLLEFGHNQGWDSSMYPGNWYNASQYPGRWQEIVAMIGSGGYGLNVLPYYEYCGSQGQAPDSLGKQRLCRPLTRDDTYTHITWSEGAYCDVTDSRFVDEVAKLLDCTVRRVIGGARPHNRQPVTGGYVDGANCWGYVDFGPNWQNFRIRSTWTMSRKWNPGPASPFAELYWHSDPSAFLSGGAHVVPGSAIAETRLNFVTKYQSSAYTWQSDVVLPAGQEIAPARRYLIVRRPSPATNAQELAFVGYIAGGDEQLQVLPIAGAAQLKAGNDGWLAMASFFDDAPQIADTDVPFVGAWFRTRVSAMPVSFADAALQRYGQDRNGGVAVTRAQLTASPILYADYINWWNGKRQGFLNAVRDVVRQQGLNDQADLLFTWDATESGKGYPDFALHIVTDDVATWSQRVPGAAVTSLDNAIASNYHLTALTMPVPNWGGWEWQHSMPVPDVANYADSDGVLMTYSFNKAHTVGSPAAFEAFRTASGLAIIRHYCLNENAIDENEGGIVGYFVGDMEPAGPYVVMGEARAMADGDPRYIGYLASSNFNRGFPQYVREFNANFLALPALPSTVLSGAASDPAVVVRSIDAGAHGTYLAVVNTALTSKSNVTVRLPAGAQEASMLATSETLAAPGGLLTLDLYPCQLVSLHIDDGLGSSLPGDFNGDGYVTQADYTIWADTFGNDGSPGKEDLRADANGDGRITHGDYTLWADHFGQGTPPVNRAPSVDAGANQTIVLPTNAATLHATVSDDGRPSGSQMTMAWSMVSGPAAVNFTNVSAEDATATFSAAGQYVLRLTASDGSLSAHDDVTITVSSEPVNQAPTVNAGADQHIVLPANAATLDAAVQDDGLPATPGHVSVQWTNASGGGTVTFADAAAVDTTATFSDPGTYVLRLSAFDGELTAQDEVSITVDEQPPASPIIITPVLFGQASGSQYCPASGAFNAQPTWDAALGNPVGDEPNAFAGTETEYPGRHWYIDFGPNFAQCRIYSVWTRYRPYSGGSYGGYADLWWDDDTDNAIDDGVIETRINFAKAQGVPNLSEQLWLCDVDFGGSPVTPSRRYLLVSVGTSPPGRANEFAFVGSFASSPMTVSQDLIPAAEPSAVSVEGDGRAKSAERRRAALMQRREQLRRERESARQLRQQGRTK